MPNRKYQSFKIKNAYQQKLKKVSKKVSEPVYMLVEHALDDFLNSFEDNPPAVERHTKHKFELIINDLQNISEDNQRLIRENELYKRSHEAAIQ